MFIFRIVLIFLIFFCHFGSVDVAAYEPLSVPNNKVGIHILFPEEIETAAKLVNNDRQGAWGYVVVPIQTSDRDRLKWQKFFDNCKKLQVIPIIRIATGASGPHWYIPTGFDLIDFANFLDDLEWPTKNRYVIFLNEVNRHDEYGGKADPEDYVKRLDEVIDILKSKSTDFFVMSAGLDNAASDRRNSILWNTYLSRMYHAKPDIFNKVDGWVSHAYANPDFSSRPDGSGPNKIDSFVHDLKFIEKYTQKKLPVFVTETGWSSKNLSDHQISLYYTYAFQKVWNHPQVVTVAPFLLNAQDGPFVQFSFLDSDHNLKEFGSTLSSFASIGEPVVIPEPTPTPEPTMAISSPSSEIILGAKTTEKVSFVTKIYLFLVRIFT